MGKKKKYKRTVRMDSKGCFKNPKTGVRMRRKKRGKGFTTQGC